MSATANLPHGVCSCTWGAEEYLKTADEHGFCVVHDCEGCGYPRGCCADEGGCKFCNRYVREGRKAGV